MTTQLVGRRAESAVLDELLMEVLDGRSRAVVLRGGAGIGKTALLDQLANSLDGWSVVRATGVESELELPYSGLHQLCSPLLSELERLPDPQREALATVFGLSAGPAPDRFLVGLATLTLVAEVAEQQPLLCIVDDAQWLDQASEQILGFVARRLLAERIAMICSARTGVGDHVLAGIDEIPVAGLPEGAARALLLRHLPGPLDGAVYEQIITESHGNPLALLEFGRSSRITSLAGGFGVPESSGLAGKIELAYAQRLDVLSAETRLLVLLAAAEPLGDRFLLRRAGEHLGVGMAALTPAVDAGLISVDLRLEFAHPLVRSAVYRSAGEADRRRVHAALAEATDPETDPDRRAWHRARATEGPDEEVAAELERSAARAQARGGVGAAAAFLRRAVQLTPDEALRSQRALTAAQTSLQAGALDAALETVTMAEAGELDELARAQAELLRGHLALVSSYNQDAVPLLLRAARRLEPIDLEFARRAYLMAWGATVTAGHLADVTALEDICRSVRALPPLPAEPHPLDLLLDGLARVVTEGRIAATPVLQRAAEAVAEMPAEDVLRWGWIAPAASAATWDLDRYGAIFRRQAQIVREAGVLAELPQHLTGLAWYESFTGDLASARLLVADIDSVAAAIGTPLPPFAALRLQSLQGRPADAEPLIADTLEQALAAGQGIAAVTTHWAAAVLYNGLARYDEAAAAAQQVVDHARAPFMTNFALPELVEAASRRGDIATATEAVARLTESTQPSGTHWAFGIEARCRALISEGEVAERAYEDSIAQLSRTVLRGELARAHLLYGEWLRHEGRRAAAREHLRAGHDVFVEIGMEAFAARARHALTGVGAAVHVSDPAVRDELTGQEERIARLARDGLSNREIAGTLYLSNRTIEWHMRKVFVKLGINSRSQLQTALSDGR